MIGRRYSNDFKNEGSSSFFNKWTPIEYTLTSETMNESYELSVTPYSLKPQVKLYCRHDGKRKCSYDVLILTSASILLKSNRNSRLGRDAAK